ncbi:MULTISPECIES: DUF768 domain-containing protein [Mesorhizobium]|uniref:DUF768 domain-containing protein n=1 Tax=Mesorhizobium wenxiniae TaxID=2014805 RepID=A0A271KND0_9HYPH|nr:MULTISPECIES: DUF768 domain-containing protein [Mesorhizobium]PAP96535.1 DUF768 domain-containing protein [Mesorhizobium wenxiniae]RWL18703.1 MAG: DUF768 domain-containing protein [Mesorhizobium sp.]RWM65340.1 MAG: DUF768 domain-containing protein [Mesorhizobium sp.]TIO21031.1 MAG: DUF768 domain-containing protein [Mesorhizobium sp.]TJV62477.1 MAG: DUF768 domain-containing protein [Mesorhizobium sp.]
MSTRGTNFFYKWLSNNLPAIVRADVISVSELAHKLFADAKSLGISRTEIEEDTGGVHEAILDAIVHHDAGVVG